MAAYKIAAEAGHALSQWQGGSMYGLGKGVAVDFEQARPWLEKAAAQDDLHAVSQLGVMYSDGKGVAPSWRRARELYERATELGSSAAVENMQNLTGGIANVTRRQSHLTPAQIYLFAYPVNPTSHPISSRSAPPS